MESSKFVHYKAVFFLTFPGNFHELKNLHLEKENYKNDIKYKQFINGHYIYAGCHH